MIMSPEIAEFLAWDAKTVRRMAVRGAHIEGIITDLVILLDVNRKDLIDAFDNWVLYTNGDPMYTEENWGFVQGYLMATGTIPFDVNGKCPRLGG